MNNSTVLLELKAITKRFHGLVAVRNVDLKVMEGEIFGLIGPNGAGKTTIFNLISGVLQKSKGVVLYNNEDITNLRTDQIVRRGLVRTFQGNIYFPDYTVMENILMGCHMNDELNIFSFFGILFSLRYNYRKEKRMEEKAYELIDFLGLTEYTTELAKNLPHGFLRTLGIAIALATNPKLLMLDEPVSGMTREERLYMLEILKQIKNKKNISILLIEHDMKMVMDVCDRIAVLNFGEKICEGTPEQVRANEEVIKAYLGDVQNGIA